MVIATQNKEPINREPRKYADSDDKEFISDRFPTLKAVGKPNTTGHAEESPAEEAKTGFFTPNEKIDFSNVKIEEYFEDQVDFDTFSKSD